MTQPLIDRFKEMFGVELRPVLSKTCSYIDLTEDTIKEDKEVDILEKYLLTLVHVSLLRIRGN